MKRINDLIEKLLNTMRELGNRPSGHLDFYMIDSCMMKG